VNARLLLVEDDEARAVLLVRALTREHECVRVRTADEALHVLAAGGWSAAIVDYDLGSGGTGLLVLQAVHLLSERTVRVLYTSYYSSALAQDAERLAGAHAVLDARRGEFLLDLGRALRRLLGQDPAPIGRDTPLGGDGAGPWCARAPASLRLLEELLQAAAESAPVYVHGEPGSGKHLAVATLQRWRRERAGEAGADRGAPAPAGSPGREPSVRVIRVPALRERREDIAGLAERFLAGVARNDRRAARRLGPEALAELEGRTWWGNVRELHAVLYRAAAAAGDRVEITPADVPRDIVPPESVMRTAKHKGMLQAALLHLRTAGSIRAAAALAGESRPNYKRRLNQIGVLRADVLYEPEEGEGE
jgi:DNA-binding NtrC family response regulator